MQDLAFIDDSHHVLSITCSDVIDDIISSHIASRLTKVRKTL